MVYRVTLQSRWLPEPVVRTVHARSADEAKTLVEAQGYTGYSARAEEAPGQEDAPEEPPQEAERHEDDEDDENDSDRDFE
jgi:hypothetical protein